MNQFSIRPATERDAEAVQCCLETAFAPYATKYSRDAFLDTVPTLENVYQRFTWMSLFVAVDESGSIFGTIACYVKTPEEGHVRGMAVREAWQGKGIAQQLLSAAESELRRRGCVRVSLDTTDPLQRAIHFYEKQGYRRSGEITDFYGMPLHEFIKELG